MRWVICAALAIAPVTARADWQFTKWGDSVATVLAYQAEGMRRTTEAEAENKSIKSVGQALATSKYRTPEFDTVANYLFRADALVGVALRLYNKGDAARALARLEAQYGTDPSRSEGKGAGCQKTTATWTDRERGNIVAFRAEYCMVTPSETVGITEITYTPIVSARDSGL